MTCDSDYLKREYLRHKCSKIKYLGQSLVDAFLLALWLFFLFVSPALASSEQVAVFDKFVDEYVDEYAAVLSADPEGVESNNLPFSVHASVHNSGADDSSEAVYWITAYNQPLSTDALQWSLAAQLADINDDYEFYGRLRYALTDRQAGETPLQFELLSHWQWQLECLYDAYNAAAFDRDSDYEEISWALESGLQRELWPPDNNSLSLYIGLRYQSIERHGQLVNPLNGNRVSADTEQLLVMPVVGIDGWQSWSAVALYYQLRYRYNIKAADDADDQYAVARLGRFDTKFRYRQITFYGELDWALTADRYHLAKTQQVFNLQLNAMSGFGERLIPQAQWSIGGKHSVRVYDESIVSADSTFSIRAEWRYLWRVFDAAPWLAPWVQQRAFLFFDAGSARSEGGQWTFTINGNEFDYDQDSVTTDLRSAGLGIHLELRHGFAVTLESGWVLAEIDALAEQGDQRSHITLGWTY